MKTIQSANINSLSSSSHAHTTSLLLVTLLALGTISILTIAAVPTAHADPLATNIPVGNFPSQVASNPNTNTVYVINQNSNSTSVIDGATNTVTGTITIPEAHQGIAVDPNTDLIYASAGGGNVYVIDGSTNAIVHTINTGAGTVGLEQIAVNPVTDTIYVLGVVNNMGGGYGVFVINGATNTVTTSIPLFGYAIMAIAVNSATNTIYVSGEDYSPGQTYSVYAINGATNTVIDHLQMVGDGIAANPVTDRVYISNGQTITVLNGTTNTVIGTISQSGDSFYGLGVNPSNDKVYATDGTQFVYTIDGSTNSVVQSTSVGSQYSETNQVAVNTATDMVYVSDTHSNEVSVINGNSGSTTTSQLTVTSQDTYGNTLKGYYTILYQNGQAVATGFTPTTFTVNDGQDYVVQADSYGNCIFAYWADTGMSAASRSISISSNTQLTAVYNCNYSSDSSVTVSSVNQNGASIFGYYVLLSNSEGTGLNQGYTTQTFPTLPGTAYTIAADGYNNCNFSQWSDGVTTNPRSFTATSGSLQFTAVLDCPAVTTSSVTVNSVDQNGNAINGYYVVLRDAHGNVAGTGFTPTTFITTIGDNYILYAYSYGSCTFSHWTSGVTDDPITITATEAPQTYTGVYECTSSTTSVITVSTVNGYGSTINGYYTSLWQNGAQVSSCFSTCSFTVNNGQTYQVYASSYGSETFNHWANDGSTGAETVSVPSSSTTMSLTAVYSP